MPDIMSDRSEQLGDISPDLCREVIEEIRARLHQQEIACDDALNNAADALLADMKKRATLGCPEGSVDALLGKMLAAGLYFKLPSTKEHIPVVCIRGLAGNLLSAAHYAGLVPRGPDTPNDVDDEAVESIPGTLINGLAVRGEILSIYQNHPLWVEYRQAWQDVRDVDKAIASAEKCIKIVEDALAEAPPTGRPVILGEPPPRGRAKKEA